MPRAWLSSADPSGSLRAKRKRDQSRNLKHSGAVSHGKCSRIGRSCTEEAAWTRAGVSWLKESMAGT
eukprot:13390455-Heterocapsa_arctica.AAC.1